MVKVMLWEFRLGKINLRGQSESSAIMIKTEKEGDMN